MCHHAGIGTYTLNSFGLQSNSFGLQTHSSGLLTDSFALQTDSFGLQTEPRVVAHTMRWPGIPMDAYSSPGCLWFVARIYTVQYVDFRSCQLDLKSLMPLSVAGCGQLQLGVPHWATSEDYCKQLIIDPTFCGSRFSTRKLLAIEDFTVSCCRRTISGYRWKVSGYKRICSCYRRIVLGYRRTFSGYRQTVSGNSRTVSGYRRTVSGYRWIVSGYIRTVSGYRRTVTGYIRTVTRLRVTDGQFRVLNGQFRVPNGQLRVIDGQFQVTNRLLLTFSHWLLIDTRVTEGYEIEPRLLVYMPFLLV